MPEPWLVGDQLELFPGLLRILNYDQFFAMTVEAYIPAFHELILGYRLLRKALLDPQEPVDVAIFSETYPTSHKRWFRTRGGSWSVTYTTL